MRSVGQINGTFAAKDGEDDTFEEIKFDLAFFPQRSCGTLAQGPQAWRQPVPPLPFLDPRFCTLWLHDGSKPAGGRIAGVVRFLPCHRPHPDGLGNSVHVQYAVGVEHS